MPPAPHQGQEILVYLYETAAKICSIETVASMANYTITCSSCGTANRIPASKEGMQGRCGSCQATLAPLYCHPQQLTDKNFDAFVKNYPGPVLAEFWAPW
jgi:thioredoxin 2